MEDAARVDLEHNAQLVLVFLVLGVDHETRSLATTKDALGEAFGFTFRALIRALDALSDAGLIEADFHQGHQGAVTVTETAWDLMTDKGAKGGWIGFRRSGRAELVEMELSHQAKRVLLQLMLMVDHETRSIEIPRAALRASLRLGYDSSTRALDALSDAGLIETDGDTVTVTEMAWDQLTSPNEGGHNRVSRESHNRVSRAPESRLSRRSGNALPLTARARTMNNLPNPSVTPTVCAPEQIEEVEDLSTPLIALLEHHGAALTTSQVDTLNEALTKRATEIEVEPTVALDALDASLADWSLKNAKSVFAVLTKRIEDLEVGQTIDEITAGPIIDPADQAADAQAITDDAEVPTRDEQGVVVGEWSTGHAGYWLDQQDLLGRVSVEILETVNAGVGWVADNEHRSRSDVARDVIVIRALDWCAKPGHVALDRLKRRGFTVPDQPDGFTEEVDGWIETTIDLTSPTGHLADLAAFDARLAATPWLEHDQEVA